MHRRVPNSGNYTTTGSRMGHCSPNNSDDEEEEDVNDEESGEMGTTGLVFGHDKCEDESDD